MAVTFAVWSLFAYSWDIIRFFWKGFVEIELKLICDSSLPLQVVSMGFRCDDRRWHLLQDSIRWQASPLFSWIIWERMAVFALNNSTSFHSIFCNFSSLQPGLRSRHCLKVVRNNCLQESQVGKNLSRIWAFDVRFDDIFYAIRMISSVVISRCPLHLRAWGAWGEWRLTP